MPKHGRILYRISLRYITNIDLSSYCRRETLNFDGEIAKAHLMHFNSSLFRHIYIDDVVIDKSERLDIYALYFTRASCLPLALNFSVIALFFITRVTLSPGHISVLKICISALTSAFIRRHKWHKRYIVDTRSEAIELHRRRLYRSSRAILRLFERDLITRQ